ncbi:MAG: D-glycero-beta-D-manno-heptose-7-phosphate kinase [Thermodesulfovibrionia bacterium]|nr:D-glycero-beta-D-manno-heptose-7-phosphate kinase [Thermodesulfovibrionia bacterium]
MLTENIKNIFKKFDGTGILVIGDLMVDHYIWGKVKRISPEAPVPVVEVEKENLLLGGSANVAHNILSLGGKVFITGTVGSDDTGKLLINKLLEKGFNTDGIVIDGNRPTTVKTRVIAHSQQMVRFDREIKSDISKPTLSLILDYVTSCLPDIKGIIISDYSKGLITKILIKKLLNLTKSKIFIAVDPKIGHFDYYKGASLITPNVNEASFASSIDIKDDKTLAEAGNTLLKKLQCMAVIITRGDEGMSLFEKSGKITHIPTCAREVYDVSGAGDTVISALTLCHSAGAALEDAAIIANHAAGVVVGKVGTAVATRQEILENMKTCKPL